MCYFKKFIEYDQLYMCLLTILCVVVCKRCLDLVECLVLYLLLSYSVCVACALEHLIKITSYFI